LTYIKGAIEQDFSREAADCQATTGMAWRIQRQALSSACQFMMDV